MAGRGIQHQPIRIPAQWDPEWFERVFIREVLSKLDVRNANEGLGISIEGTPDQPATISASDDLGQLYDADFILSEASELLPNARVIEGEDGVSVTDEGPGGSLRVGLEVHGVQFDRLPQFPELSLLANGDNAVGSGRFVRAEDNDTVLGRVGDALRFTQLTEAMAPDGLWPAAKLASGVQASLALADTALQEAVRYIPQSGASHTYTDADFIHGHNIIGLRYAGSAEVSLPADLAVEKIIVIRAEDATGFDVDSGGGGAPYDAWGGSWASGSWGDAWSPESGSSIATGMTGALTLYADGAGNFYKIAEVA
jgi:hypothetical protein